MPHSERPLTARPRPNLIVCASAASRLAWCGGALILLWMTVYWAMT